MKGVINMSRKYMYLLERIKDGKDWSKGMRIWYIHPCTGWRVIEKIKVEK